MTVGYRRSVMSSPRTAPATTTGAKVLGSRAVGAIASDLDTSSRWLALEGLRGIAVLAVVLFHATRLVLLRDGGSWGDEVSSGWWWTATGRFGVDVFFVLAGFLVVGSWRSARARHPSLGAAVRDFAGRRAWRILPPYWVSLVVLVPLVAPRLLAPSGWADLARFASVQQYVETALPSEVNVVYWSLTTEVHFYLLVPVLAWSLHRLGGWPLVLGTSALGLWWVQGAGQGDLPASFIGGRLHQFAIGAAAAGLVARHLEGGRPSRLVRLCTRPGVAWAIAGAFVAMGWYHGATYRRPGGAEVESALHIGASFLLAAVVIRLVCGEQGGLCDRRPLRFCGLVSFSLYLWHFPVIDAALGLLGVSGGGATTGPLAALAAALCVAVSLAVGTGAYLAVERPLPRRRERTPSSPEPTSPAPPSPIGAVS